MMVTKKRLKARRGFTLIELIIATAIMVIVMLAVGMVLVDGQRGWSNMYNRTQSGVVTESYAARRKFDSVMRKASGEWFLLDSGGSWIEVYYYASAGSALVDRYTRFYVAGGNLYVEYGQLNSKITLSVETLCGNVSSCVFKQAGKSVQMVLTLDDGEQDNTIVCSAVLHN